MDTVNCIVLREKAAAAAAAAVVVFLRLVNQYGYPRATKKREVCAWKITWEG